MKAEQRIATFIWSRPKIFGLILSAIIVSASAFILSLAGSQKEADMKSSVSASVQQQSGKNAHSQNSAQVVINGKEEPIPPSGEIHKIIVDGNTTTKVDVRVHNQSSGNTSSQSTEMNIDGSATLP